MEWERKVETSATVFDWLIDWLFQTRYVIFISAQLNAKREITLL